MEMKAIYYTFIVYSRARRVQVGSGSKISFFPGPGPEIFYWPGPGPSLT